MLLVVNPSVQANSVGDLISLAKSRAGQLNFANSGSGTTAHVAGELFKRMAGVDNVGIAYKGGGPAVIDLIAYASTHYPFAHHILPGIRSVAGSGGSSLIGLSDKLPLRDAVLFNVAHNLLDAQAHARVAC